MTDSLETLDGQFLEVSNTAMNVMLLLPPPLLLPLLLLPGSGKLQLVPCGCLLYGGPSQPFQWMCCWALVQPWDYASNAAPMPSWNLHGSNYVKQRHWMLTMYTCVIQLIRPFFS